MKLKVYDFDSDSWDTVEGSPLPEQILKPFSVNSCDCKIYVVGRDLHVAVGKILKSDSEKKIRFSVEWVVVDVPNEFSELTPSSLQVLFA